MQFKRHLQRYLQKARFPFVALAPISLMALGWYSLVEESKVLENNTVVIYQQAQLEVVRGAARSASLFVEQQLEQDPAASLVEIEQELLENFVVPLGVGELGDAWIYAPTHVVFDRSADFPAAYRDKNMAEIFAIQRHKGASHYEDMTAAVMAVEEGVGWYIWEPDKALAATPWWEVFTQDAGREVAAWTPMKVFPGTPAEQTWVIGISAMLPELMQANGTYKQVQASLGVMLALSGVAGSMVWLLWRSECSRRDRNQEIHRLAYADMLTGLANRRQMYAVGDGILADVNRREDLALIYLDLNGFKDVNDSLGHDFGDSLLIEVGRCLRDCLRQQDLLARLGGDEFAILLHPRSLEDARTVAQRMLQRLRQPFYIKGKSILIGASLGIAPVKAEVRGLNFSQLLTQADIAMYQAKQRGSDAVVVFGEEMQRAAIARVNLEMDLRQAIPKGELRLHYQPIFSLNDEGGTTVPQAFEALVRWQHPQRGLLWPQDFLPEAENIGKLVDIDRWVMVQACQTLAQWQLDLDDDHPLGIHVNLSRLSLAQPDLVPFVRGLLDRYELQPRRLTLEILEETIIDESPILEENLHALRGLGVRLSLDDFGTGYSSLSYLHRLPVHGIKIDRSFVSQMQSSRKNEEIIRSIVALAQSLGLETVAEGIELSEQLSRLKSLNCTYAQGHLLSDGVEEELARAMVFEGLLSSST